MTEQRAVVEVQLGIEGQHFIVCRHDKRVRLDEAAILVREAGIEPLHEFHGLANDRLRQVQAVGHARALEGLQADSRVDNLFEDLLRRLGSYGLDIHAARLGAHHHHARCLTVNDKGEIILVTNACAGLDEQALYLFACRARLLRHQRLAQQFIRILPHLSQRFGNLDTARLATAARMDLRLDHRYRSRQLLCCGDGFLNAEGREAFRHSHTVLFQDLFALIFMDVHGAAPL